jgi:hypothetical protein
LKSRRGSHRPHAYGQKLFAFIGKLLFLGISALFMPLLNMPKKALSQPQPPEFFNKSLHWLGKIASKGAHLATA